MPAVLEKLRIFPYLEEIVRKISAHLTIQLVAPTGTGKSLGTPAALASKGNVIFVCVPTIEAAESLAYMQRQMSPHLRVGLAARGDVRYISRDKPNFSQVVYCTYGHMRRLLVKHPQNQLLAFCDVLMVDEAHTMPVDVSMILALWMKFYELGLAQFPNRLAVFPHLVAATATPAELDLKPAPTLIEIKDIHPFSVKVHHIDKHLEWEDPETFYEEGIEQLTKWYPQTEQHVLFFLPGSKEVEAVAEIIRERAETRDAIVIPVYGAMQGEQVKQMYEDVGTKRKIIVATNIAEAALTIENVGLIINVLLEKIADTSASGGFKLVLVPIAKMSAVQRKGRTGRTCPGICVHICTSEQYERLNESRLPELQRVPLYNCILELMANGFEPEILPISASKIKKAKRLLLQLEMIRVKELRKLEEKRVENDSWDLPYEKVLSLAPKIIISPSSMLKTKEEDEGKDEEDKWCTDKQVAHFDIVEKDFDLPALVPSPFAQKERTTAEKEELPKLDPELVRRCKYLYGGRDGFNEFMVEEELKRGFGICHDLVREHLKKKELTAAFKSHPGAPQPGSTAYAMDCLVSSMGPFYSSYPSAIKSTYKPTFPETKELEEDSHGLEDYFDELSDFSSDGGPTGPSSFHAAFINLLKTMDPDKLSRIGQMPVKVEYEVSPAGRFAPTFPLGARNAAVLWKWLQTDLNPYVGIVLVSCLEAYGPSYLWYPPVDRKKSKWENDAIRQAHKHKYFERFTAPTELHVFLLVWQDLAREVGGIFNYNLRYVPARRDFMRRLSTWCRDNSMNKKKIIELVNCVKQCCNSLARFNKSSGMHKSGAREVDFDIGSAVNCALPFIQIAYRDKEMTRIPFKPGLYKLTSTDEAYRLDGFQTVGTLAKSQPSKLLGIIMAEISGARGITRIANIYLPRAEPNSLAKLLPEDKDLDIKPLGRREEYFESQILEKEEKYESGHTTDNDNEDDLLGEVIAERLHSGTCANTNKPKRVETRTPPLPLYSSSSSSSPLSSSSSSSSSSSFSSSSSSSQSLAESSSFEKGPIFASRPPHLGHTLPSQASASDRHDKFEHFHTQRGQVWKWKGQKRERETLNKGGQSWAVRPK